jgi:hypothetical protein
MEVADSLWASISSTGVEEKKDNLPCLSTDFKICAFALYPAKNKNMNNVNARLFILVVFTKVDSRLSKPNFI